MRRFVLLMISVLVCLFVAGSSIYTQTKAPDLIIVNAKIYTVDSKFSTAEGVAITDGKFTAVGTTAQIRKLSGLSTRILDAGGKTIVPGLQDNHLHNAGGGPGVDLFNARTLEDVLDRIGARAKEAKPGDVVVTNSDWHEAQLKDQRLPYRKDLDKIAPKVPVVVVRGGHEYILNSAALDKWQIDKATPQPAGGRISREENGELNGELVDRAKALVTLPPEPQPGPAYFLEEHKKLNAAGLTAIRYPGAGIEQYRALQELEKKGLLTIRVNQLLRPPATDAATMAKMLASYNVKPEEGNEWLRLGGVKLGVDGGFEGGWMTELYEKPYDEGGKYYGINTLKQEPFTAIVKELNRLGWRVATHAVGDAAIHEVLAAYEAADAEKSIFGRRWTIEHAFIPRPDHFPRMKRLRLIISAQDHLYIAATTTTKMEGPQNAPSTTPFCSYLGYGPNVLLGAAPS